MTPAMLGLGLVITLLILVTAFAILKNYFVNKYSVNEDKYKYLIEKLWGIIDDIDTYSDVAKSNDLLYRQLAESRHRDRWALGINTDGHGLHYDLSSIHPQFDDSRAMGEDLDQLVVQAAMLRSENDNEKEEATPSYTRYLPVANSNLFYDSENRVLVVANDNGGYDVHAEPKYIVPETTIYSISSEDTVREVENGFTLIGSNLYTKDNTLFAKINGEFKKLELRAFNTVDPEKLSLVSAKKMWQMLSENNWSVCPVSEATHLCSIKFSGGDEFRCYAKSNH